MQPDGTTLVAVVRRRDQLEAVDDRRRRRKVTSGEWVKVVAGAYARSKTWRRLRPEERHRVRVLEIMRRLQHPTVVSHLSAAVLWGIDVLGEWPSTLDVITERRSGGRSGGAVRRHALGLEGVERIPFRGHFVTTPAQTALDLARSLPFVRAVSAVDQALWAKRRGGPLTTKGEIFALMDAAPRRGDARARRVIRFASHLADNVRESQNRVVVVHLGFPEPRLQERRVLPSGRVAYGDMYFVDFDHWVEIDGRGKYRGAYDDDRDPADIVIDEKNRENEIRRVVRAFSRWEATDADDPALIYAILTGDGLPSSKPPP